MARHGMNVGYPGGFLGGQPGGPQRRGQFPSGFLGGNTKFGAHEDVGDDSGDPGNASAPGDAAPADGDPGNSSPPGPDGPPADDPGPPTVNPINPDPNPQFNPYSFYPNYNPYAPSTPFGQKSAADARATTVDDPKYDAIIKAFRDNPFPYTDAIKGAVPNPFNVFGLATPGMPSSAKVASSVAGLMGSVAGVPGFASVTGAATNAAQATINAISAATGASAADVSAAIGAATGGNGAGPGAGAGGAGNFAPGELPAEDVQAPAQTSGWNASAPAGGPRSPLLNSGDYVKRRFGGLSIGV